MKIGNRWIACFSSQVCFDSICSVCGATVMLRKEAAAVHIPFLQMLPFSIHNSINYDKIPNSSG